MAWEQAPPSGDPEIDSLAERRWTVGALTYSFPTSSGQFTGYSGGEPTSNFEALNVTQQAAVRSIYASLSNFTNLTFSENTGANASSATLRFGMTNETSTAHAYQPSDSELGGDSWYNNAGVQYDLPVIGTYAWHTFLHEIGHTLGLIHPHTSTPAMSGDRDWMAYTVMSYRSQPNSSVDEGYFNDPGSFPQSFMMEDIAALQFLYGANFNTNAGNTVYRWGETTGEMSINGVGQGVPYANKVFLTIWDGGGNDTYDFSNTLNYNGQIDLRPGAWNYFSSDQQAQLGGGGRPPGNVANSLLYNNDPRSLIENAIGTRFDDSIYGNDVANALTGGLGSDTIRGALGNDALYGGDGIDWLYGDEGNDTLYGDGSVDLLYGGAGNDTLYGGDEADQMEGGEGDDRLEGGAGNDGVHGGAGKDHLLGGDGEDVLSGGEGDDILIAGGGAANDLYGFTGNDTLVGSAGNDRLDGHLGIDVMTGGLGDDIYGVNDAGDQIIELVGQGFETVEATVSYVASLAIENVMLMDWTYFEFGGPPPLTGPINATGNSLNNLLRGNSEANILRGLGGIDSLSGGQGDDVLDGGTGADQMFGNLGNDHFHVDNVADAAVEEAGQGTSDRVFASVSYTLGAGQSIELMSTTNSAGTGAINLTGNELANTMLGNAGANVLNGRAGIDRLTGLAGNDHYYIDNARDVVVEAAGQGTSDRVFASVTYALGAGQSIELMSTTNSAGTGAINLTGNELANTILGNAGANVLNGGAGADTMTGLGGSDHFYVDNVGDVVIEAAGQGTSDRVFASVSYALGAGQSIELMSTTNSAGTGAINLTGNELANTILGNAGANVLNGRAGIDRLTGLAGNDTYYIDNAGDTVFEAAGGGDDTVITNVHHTLGAGQHVETLRTYGIATTESIKLIGNELPNAILGNAAVNVLDGKGGADSLRGYGGKDSFTFTSALGPGNVDTIADFSHDDDTIVLDDAVFAGLGLGALAAGAFRAGAAATDADDRIIYNGATGQLLFDADGVGGSAAVQFAILTSAPAINASDFLVI